jgi:hypothetical protein
MPKLATGPFFNFGREPGTHTMDFASVGFAVLEIETK